MPFSLKHSGLIFSCKIFAVFCMFTFMELNAKNNSSQRSFIIDYLSTKDGLSQSEITSIAQDSFGFMWFGTRGGVNKYDGYEFKQFKPHSPITGMISPSTEVMLIDNSNNLWVGTKSGGLCRYNLTAEKFYEADTILKNLPYRITALYQDFSSNIWIGTWQDGVYKYDYQNNKLHHYLEDQRVSSITQTSDSTLWFGIGNWLVYLKNGEDEMQRIRLKQGFYEITEMVENVNDSCLWMVGWNTGLLKLNYKTHLVEIHELLNLNILNNTTYSLLMDETENLYVGTWGKGLYYYDTKTKRSEIISLSVNKEDYYTPNLNIILDIYKDNEGNIWLGTDGSGAVKLSDTKHFNTISASSTDKLGAMHVNAVFEDNKGRLWFGTREKGLFVTTDFKDIRSVKVKESNQDVYFIKSIHQDSQGNIWIGSSGQYNNILLVDEQSNGDMHLVKPIQISNSPFYSKLKKITAIYSDNNRMYFGTQQAGLFVFEKRGSVFEFVDWFHQDDDNKTFQDNRITSIKPDVYGNLWVSTYKGLYVINSEHRTPVNVFSYYNLQEQISCDIVLCCWPDNKGKIWFGTPCNINYIEYSLPAKIVKSFNADDGLIDEYVNAITGMDDDVWFSTNSGISKLDINTKGIRNFNVKQGVGDYNFSEGAVALGKNRNVYFGGYSDLTYFVPDEIKPDKDIPAIAFTSFKILNKEVPVEEQGFLKNTINAVSHITINHTQKEFSFSVAVLDFTTPGDNKYGYRINSKIEKGDWIYTGSRRHISFSNLKPGDYTLQFIGSNSNNIWNREGKTISIKVLPPPWKTWYAILIYICIFIVILYVINRVTVKQERLKNKLKIEQNNRLKELEINEFKLSFFTDITHEIKTPVALIQGPVKELIDKGFQNISASLFENRIRLIYNNTIRLSNLLSQLLEFRKIETGKTVLKASPNNIAVFVKEISENFVNHAKHLNVSFTRNINVKNAVVWFDPFKLDIVITNLLVNAFKFCSNENGKVSITLNDFEGFVTVEVCNDGDKILENEIDQLFNRFYQGTNKGTKRGSGIGLYLVKSYVDLHNGEISVNFNADLPTCFTVKLLKGKDHLKAENIVEESQDFKVANKDLPILKDLPAAYGVFPKGVLNSTILIVDDNEEMNKYLRNIFGAHFKVYTEFNGIDGFKTAADVQPDLIISDIVMPGADGFEFCARLKSNELTKHIPVLLLTAREDKNDNLKSLQRGAEAYMQKPFDPTTLFEKCKQLIATRITLKEKYSKRVVLEATNREITSTEEKMINKSIFLIEKNAGKKLLNSEFLAQEIGMSPSTYFRKIKKATGKSPGELIKETRLKLAARYLKESDITVSEIIETVGYSDANHFRENFKDAFGMLPDEYRKSN